MILGFEEIMIGEDASVCSNLFNNKEVSEVITELSTKFSNKLKWLIFLNSGTDLIDDGTWYCEQACLIYTDKQNENRGIELIFTSWENNTVFRVGLICNTLHGVESEINWYWDAKITSKTKNEIVKELDRLLSVYFENGFDALLKEEKKGNKNRYI